MRAPRSWIAEFVDLPSTISDAEIVAGLERVGFEVEETIIQGADLSGPLVVGKVIEIEELKEQKKPIRYVALDCGEKELRYVICGAQNFRVGDLVVVSLPGAVLPGGFAISARQTYGKTSNGMICSARELGLGEDHSGIIVLPAASALPGADAISLLEINDTIFDVSVNPDRGYALSIRGIAREVAASLKLAFSDPIDALKTRDQSGSGNATPAKIVEGASLMYLRTLEGYRPDSDVPLWMRRRIEKAGMRSISLAVDVTNYVMLELGQPLHAFDADAINGTLTIRRAGMAQKFTTLDGQERMLHPDDLVVADDKNVLALAGTMGGLESEISEKTTRISVEAVRFDPLSIARNSRRHNLSTEASRRFERAVDVGLARHASLRAAELLLEYGGATYVGTATDGLEQAMPKIDVEPAYFARRIGMDIRQDVAVSMLELAGCTVSTSGDAMSVTPPTWRSDITSPADLSEEVARYVGYEQIPSVLPARTPGAQLTPDQKRRRVIAHSLVAQGYTEVLTFPFVAQGTIEQLGFVGARAASYRLANPMSEETPWLRPHILPGLLDAARLNFNRGLKDFAIFEMGSIFRASIELSEGLFPALGKRPSQSEIDTIFSQVPTQLQFLGGVLVGHTAPDSWQRQSREFGWSDAVETVESLLHLLGLTGERKRSDFAPWHPGRCAEFLVNGVAVAHAGELHPRVVAHYGLPARSSAWAINLDSLPPTPLVSPAPVTVMPPAVQDVALIVDAHVAAADVESALRAGAGEYLESIQLFDRYDQRGDGKVSLAFTLTWRATDRTLTGEEVAVMREAATRSAQQATGATLRTQ